ncbi:helix-turn-helix protein [Actinocorallia herbida]|uniref:Helix-turn-helix protein n=1 Tax=Actinocorallia herbida TaxID=58109 RepID=A0A3N1DCU5_9ACTN|nr:helix-turn-helix transcriptional regulator [Actinocorallia herbida]ROO82534.1 helix-turn-helix protein [Actinocorallia herbida]ROO91344.1 helix-turn-helix protein [Actinocorallia herbida]
MPTRNMRRRRLGKALEELRQATGRTPEDVAEACGWHPKKIIRWEAGDVIKPMLSGASGGILDLLDELGVHDQAERDRIAQLVADARQPDWWDRDEYQPALTPGFITHLRSEDEAAEIRTWEPRLIPGLLQCRSYMEAQIDVYEDTAPEKREALIALRLERQRRLLRGEHKLESLWAIIDEAAIRRLVGGVPVMREQIAHLIECSWLPNVQVLVSPFKSGAMRASEPFTIFSSRVPTDPETVNVELLTQTNAWFDDPQQVASYSNLFIATTRAALDREKTRELLKGWMGELGG